MIAKLMSSNIKPASDSPNDNVLKDSTQAIAFYHFWTPRMIAGNPARDIEFDPRKAIGATPRDSGGGGTMDRFSTI